MDILGSVPEEKRKGRKKKMILKTVTGIIQNLPGSLSISEYGPSIVLVTELRR